MHRFLTAIASPDERVLWGASVILASCTGILAGVAFGVAWRTQADPPRFVAGSGATVAAVSIEAFRDGAIRGTAVGPVRLFLKDDAVVIGPDGAFAAAHSELRVQEVSVAVPPGMAFVASKKGKKYHRVDSAGGERIVPDNRVYFPDAESAEAAGFRP